MSALAGIFLRIRRFIVLFASVECEGSGAGVGRTADAYAAAGIAAQAAEVAGAVAFGLWFASVSDGRDEIEREGTG